MKQLFFFAIFALLTLASCGGRTSIEKSGGLAITATFADSLASPANCQQTAELISQRMKILCTHNPTVVLQGRLLHIELPMETDSASYRKAIELVGNLEIKETYLLGDILDALVQIDEATASPNADETDEYLVNAKNAIRYPLSNLLNTKNAIGGALVGESNVADTAMVRELLSSPTAKALLPADLVFYTCKGYADNTVSWVAVKNAPAIISGDMIEEVGADLNSHYPCITIALKAPYHAAWAQATRNNIGKALALLVDNKLESYPIVNSEISGGKLSISGNYEAAYCTTMAAVLQTPLPVKVNVTEVRLVKKKD